MNDNLLAKLNDIDTAWLLAVNGAHTDWLDRTMWLLSQHLTVAVAVALFFLLLVMRVSRGVAKKLWIAVLLLVGVALCFLLADRVSVLCFKNVFQRPRPCHALEGLHMYRTRCGGMYGFVSSHAANVFAVSTFMLLHYRARRSVIADWLYVAGLTVWAFATCYSRVYLAKHYPGDVLCGALLGALLGFAVYLVTRSIASKVSSNVLQRST